MFMKEPLKTKSKKLVLFQTVCKSWSNCLYLGEKYAGASRSSGFLFFQREFGRIEASFSWFLRNPQLIAIKVLVLECSYDTHTGPFELSITLFSVVVS